MRLINGDMLALEANLLKAVGSSQYNYSCPKCSAGYLRYDNNRNSSNVRSRWDNDLVKLEVAAVECMSDFTRYSCVGTDLVELYLDSDTGEYTKSQFADVFGDSYFK